MYIANCFKLFQFARWQHYSAEVFSVPALLVYEMFILFILWYYLNMTINYSPMVSELMMNLLLLPGC